MVRYRSTAVATPLALLLLLQPAALGVITLQEMYPFGTAQGDAVVPTADNTFAKYDLLNGGTFSFFNNTYTSLFVNNNGGVSFQSGVARYTPTCGPLASPMIIPYWADIDTRNGGQVFYRQTNDPALLTIATTEVQRAFPNLSQLAINWLLIVTWSNCAFNGAAAPLGTCRGIERRNTFQLVLAEGGSGSVGSNGGMSFAIFNYNNITWTTGKSSGGDCNGQGGTRAKAGFEVGNGQTFYPIDRSCTSAILYIINTSNVNRAGQWIFRVDGSLEEPEDTSGPSAEFPVTLIEGR